MPKITKRTVDALESREREHVLWDDEIKGFGVRVHPWDARPISSSTGTAGGP